MTDQRLITIDIVAGRTLYSRTVYTEYLPTTEDLNFYYRELCGLTDAIVTSTIVDVPPDFNQALVAFSEAIPTRFPNHDITATLEDAAKIENYHNYIKQLSEMEKSRAVLQVHIKTAATVPCGVPIADPPAASTIKKRPRTHRHAWVREILQSLESEMVVGDELVALENDDLIPHAWILTPVLGSVREERGSRILVDAVKGKHWECLLGSSLFPDFVVSRRISTHNWLFQHASADALLRATLDFYIASQNATLVGGLSGWIPIADKEFTLLINTFKKIKVNEQVLTSHTDPHHIYNVLNSIELRCLASKTTNTDICPLDTHMFRKYIHYVAQGMNMPPEKYQNLEGVSQVLRRWERSEFGFRGDIDPIIPAWSKMWKLVMAGKPTVERVALFLATLDAWNPMEGNLLSKDQCDTIAEQWISIFIANETVPAVGKYEIALIAYDETRRWCLQYLPAAIFEKVFKVDRVIRDTYVKLGFNVKKSHILRIVMGLQLRNPSKKTVYEGKVVDKTPDIPDPPMWVEHPYVPKKVPKPTAMGKIRGRPPHAGSIAEKARAGLIMNMMSGNPKSEESTDSASSGSSLNGSRDIPSAVAGENELIMNLGSI